MEHLLYDFFKEVQVALLGFLLTAGCGLFGTFSILQANGKKETEVDGKMVLIKTLPLWQQILRTRITYLMEDGDPQPCIIEMTTAP